MAKMTERELERKVKEKLEWIKRAETPFSWACFGNAECDSKSSDFVCQLCRLLYRPGSISV